MTDVPSKHVWKIKESRIVFKDLILCSRDLTSHFQLQCVARAIVIDIRVNSADAHFENYARVGGENLF